MRNGLRTPQPHQERGSAIVELALSFPLIFLVASGIFQYGYFFYTYNKLAASVRSGARYASIRAYDSNSATASDAFKLAVQNQVVYGNPSGGTTPVVSGLTTSNVTLTVTMSNSKPDMMTMGITGYQLDGFFAKITLTGKPWAAFPYTGRYAPPPAN